MLPTVDSDILKSLQSFKAISILKKEALNVLVKMMDESEIHDLT